MHLNIASTGPSPVSEALFTSPKISRVISAFWGSPVPAKTLSDFNFITLSSVTKLSSTSAAISSSYIYFFLSAKILNLPKAVFIITYP